MFNRSSNLSSDISFSTSTNVDSDTSFSQKTGYTEFVFNRAENSGWGGDFITSDYYGIDELGLGAPYGQGIFSGIRHFNK